MVATISPQELKEKSDDVLLIDVRTPAEYREVHVSYARNYPLDQLNAEQIKSIRNGNADEPLYVICKSGARGRQACEKLTGSGLENVYNVEGGTEAAISTGLPVERGKQTMSLERQ